MFTKLRCCLPLVAGVLFLGVVPIARAGMINFDVDANNVPIIAPCCLAQTKALTTLYTPLGVTFAPFGGLGGYIVNQSGNFSVNARSGQNFLASNDSSGEQITFAPALSAFSIYASGGAFASSFLLQAFDPTNGLLGTNAVSTGLGAYGLLSFNAAPGTSIQVIRLTITGGGGCCLILDDLSFTQAASGPTVPEPGSFMLVVVGVSFIASQRKFRNT